MLLGLLFQSRTCYYSAQEITEHIPNETNYVPYLVGSFAAVSQIVDRARRADRCNLTSEPNKLSDLIFFF
jgi:hypothetical protein